MILPNGFKLYIVGETTGDPSKWSHYERSYVAARSKEEAVEISGMVSTVTVHQSVFPLHLFDQLNKACPEPRRGRIRLRVQGVVGHMVRGFTRHLKAK